MTQRDAPAIPVIDFNSFAAAETAKMEVLRFGQATGWFWEFAGPGHPKTIELRNRSARETLEKEAKIEQTQVNGRKWKAEAQAPDEVREKNIASVISRLIGWSEVTGSDGKAIAFSIEAATALVSHPANVQLLLQAVEFIAADDSFTPRSA